MDKSPLTPFLMVERQDGERVTVLVHHLGKPRLMVEFEPRLDAEGNITGGALKRICADNPFNGNAAKVPQLVGQAEKFFRRSLEEDKPTYRVNF
ncbi:MAG: hypothetical protein AAGF10_04710 [Verrucomicrobiota bacterium]